MRSIFEAFSHFENKVKISFAVRFAVDIMVSIIYYYSQSFFHYQSIMGPFYANITFFPYLRTKITYNYLLFSTFPWPIFAKTL